MDTLTLTIPGEPYRRTAQTTRRAVAKGGRVFVYTDKAAKRAEADLAAAFKSQLPPGWTPRADPCVVVAEWIFPYRKKDKRGGQLHPMTVRPDGDDLWKAVGDSLQAKRDGTGAGVYQDDACIFSLTVRKWRGPVPSLTVRLAWPFAPPPVPEQGVLRLGG